MLLLLLLLLLVRVDVVAVDVIQAVDGARAGIGAGIVIV
jgi:hypothetical protein